MLQWACENGCRLHEDICGMAAEGGHLEMLKWACENGCQLNERTCTCAATGGHLEALKWLSVERGYVFDGGEVRSP